MLSFPSETENGCLLNDDRGEREEGRTEREREKSLERDEARCDNGTCRGVTLGAGQGKNFSMEEYPLEIYGILG